MCCCMRRLCVLFTILGGRTAVKGGWGGVQRLHTPTSLVFKFVAKKSLLLCLFGGWIPPIEVEEVLSINTWIMALPLSQNWLDPPLLLQCFWWLGRLWYIFWFVRFLCCLWTIVDHVPGSSDPVQSHPLTDMVYDTSQVTPTAENTNKNVPAFWIWYLMQLWYSKCNTWDHLIKEEKNQSTVCIVPVLGLNVVYKTCPYLLCELEQYYH